MSAFICSDKHIATIAYNVGSHFEIEPQELANKLKAINIDSVNFRYREKTRKSKCNISDYLTIQNRYDIAGLISCWVYQACDENSLDFLAYKSLLESYVDFHKLDSNNSSVWSI